MTYGLIFKLVIFGHETYSYFKCPCMPKKDVCMPKCIYALKPNLHGVIQGDIEKDLVDSPEISSAPTIPV